MTDARGARMDLAAIGVTDRATTNACLCDPERLALAPACEP
jgi:hypothetical protein